MAKIQFIKSFSGLDHEKVLAEYTEFYNTMGDVGQTRTEFLVSHSTLHEQPHLTVIFRANEPGS